MRESIELAGPLKLRRQSWGFEKTKEARLSSQCSVLEESKQLWWFGNLQRIPLKLASKYRLSACMGEHYLKFEIE